MSYRKRPLSFFLSTFIVAFFSLLSASGLLFAEDVTKDATSSSPREEVQATVDELVTIVEAHPGEENLSQRREKLRAAIEPRFDFEEMAKRSLGMQWRKRTKEEREEFVRVFSDLLASTYLARIENIRSEMVVVDKEKVRYPKALVRTNVTYKGDEFPLDYKLLHRDKTWKVYDVIIENIGLVANYRNEFAGIIRKEQFSGLMERLREKTENAEKESSSDA